MRYSIHRDYLVNFGFHYRLRQWGSSFHQLQASEKLFLVPAQNLRDVLSTMPLSVQCNIGGGGKSMLFRFDQGRVGSIFGFEWL